MSIGGSILSLGGLAPNPLSSGYDNMIGKIGRGLDRKGPAEDLYGGVDMKGLQVPGFQGQFNNYGQMGQQYGQRGPGNSQFYGDQRGLGNILSQEARGQGVAQQLVGMQARTAADRAQSQQFAAAAGARPGMQAMAARNAALGGALAQSAVGEQAALGSAQATLGAQGQYAQFLQGARGQDLQNQGQNDQAQLEAYRQRLALSEMQQRGAISGEGFRTQRYGALLGVPTPGETALGGFTGLAGAAASGFGR